MRLVLYQPDIPGNVGAAIRAAACFGAGLEIIEPCGFPLGEKRLQAEAARAAMDYGALAPASTYASWAAFLASPVRNESRLILLTTSGETSLHDFRFRARDAIMVGRESAGVPDDVHADADVRLRIPLAAEARSLNMAVAAAIALSEARRQLGWETTPQSP